MGWDEKLNTPYELEDLIIYGDHLFSLGIPYSMPSEFKHRVFGAAKSYSMGNKSIDYTIKQYGHYWTFDEEVDEVQKYLFSLCSMVRHNSIKVIEYLMSIDNKPDLPNVYACSAAIMRLTNSFHGAVLCIRECLHFESVVISRMILEQLSWMYSIYRMTKDQDVYSKIAPHKTIGRLKEIIPAAARGYGFMSKKGHIMFDETLRYIKVSDEQIGVQLHDRYLSAQDAVNLLVLCDWLGIIGEYIYYDLLKKPLFVRLSKKNQIQIEISIVLLRMVKMLRMVKIF